MPELPEVETTRRGLQPLIVGEPIESVQVRESRLRWPVPARLATLLAGRHFETIGRRGKYLLLNMDQGTLLVHLGMSGSLRYLPEPQAPGPHDHIDINFAHGGCLRFNDPRRFGSFHISSRPLHHRLLRNLGPEPLGPDFTPEYLYACCRHRRVAIKQHLMNGRIVVGVGNIYANEALHRAGIHPARRAGRIAARRLSRLVDAVREVLLEALEQGGTTLRDFVGGDGRPGNFKLSLQVYGRLGLPCECCGETIRLRVLGQRASYYCARCQR